MEDYGKSENYINRELSWLDFNLRVLHEARDKENPLFERLKFLAITSSNLDESTAIGVSTGYISFLKYFSINLFCSSES